MTNSDPSEGLSKILGKKRRILSAEKKFQIYLEAQSSEKPVGELLRREGLYSTDLARIRQTGQGRGTPAPERQAWAAAGGGHRRGLRGDQDRTPGQGTGLGRFVSRAGDSSKKNEWGFVGPITNQWISEQIKLEILTVIETSHQQGISARRSCLILAIEHRRVVRWQSLIRQGRSLANLTPGPSEPLHRMLPEEIDQILAMAKSEAYADLSHRTLAVTAWDNDLFQASFSTVYRVLKENDLMRGRGSGGAHNGNSKAPVRKDLTGPQPAVVLGHQLPDDFPERGVSLPLPTAG